MADKKRQMDKLGLYEGKPVKVVTMEDEDGNRVEYVPVVRCKDCKKWEYDENFSGWCVEWRRRTLGDHFCSYGARKDNG